MIVIGADSLPAESWMKTGKWRFSRYKKEFTDTIGLSLSSGSDSALLLYLIAKSLSEYPTHDIHTIECWHAVDLSVTAYSSVERCNKIISAVNKMFPSISINLTTFDYQKIGNKEKAYYIKPAREKFYDEILERGPLLTGGTKQYDDDTLISLDMEILSDRTGGPAGKRPELMPFSDITKLIIANWYKRYNLMDIIFPYTVSCTRTGHGDMSMPCYECWWCKEKHHAFGLYDQMKDTSKKPELNNITFELSEKCNAACPLCVRTQPHNNSKPIERVCAKRELLIEDIKHILPKHVMKTLDKISLCGNVGDPIAAKDCLQISEYITMHTNIRLIIETNGSMRNEKWWTSLGKAFAKSHPGSKVYFHIDGLEDTNHIYRQLTNYNMIIRNAKAFISAGGTAVWEFIPFAHNEHQLEEAEILSKEIGFSEFVIRKSNRKWSKNTRTWSFTNTKGETVNLGAPTEKNLGSGVKNKSERKETKIKTIRCQYKESKGVFINCDGVLHRCCYIPADLYKPKNETTEDTYLLAAEFDLTNTMNLLTLESGDILRLSKSNSFFDQLENEWKSCGPYVCQKNCGLKISGSDRIKQ